MESEYYNSDLAHGFEKLINRAKIPREQFLFSETDNRRKYFRRPGHEMTLEVFRHQYMNYFTSVKKDTFFNIMEWKLSMGIQQHDQSACQHQLSLVWSQFFNFCHTHQLPPKNDIFLKGEKIAHQAEKYFFFTLVPPSAMKTIYTSYINYSNY